MPELPEVETTLRGIAPHVSGERFSAAVVRNPCLRFPVPEDLSERIAGQLLQRAYRRGKYLLFDCENGTLILHLGMSGSLRLLSRPRAPNPHEHVDLCFANGKLLRLRDPRRFGSLLWTQTDALRHPLLARLGLEPLSEDFNATALVALARGRKIAIKQLLMDAHGVVGVGNIYASESLFHAGIDPRRAAGRISAARLDRLVAAVKETLLAAIDAGGSSLRDFVGGDGAQGHFQQRYYVYGRGGKPCRVCGSTLKSLRLGQRASVYCPTCQR